MPPQLLDWVNRCWSQNPSHRPTALQAAEELRRLFSAVADDISARMILSLRPLPALTESMTSYSLDAATDASRVASSVQVPAQQPEERTDDAAICLEAAPVAFGDSAARSHACLLHPAEGSRVSMPQPSPEADAHVGMASASSLVQAELSSHADLLP